MISKRAAARLSGRRGLSVLVLAPGVCDTARMQTHALPAAVPAPAVPAMEEIDIPVWAWALVALAVLVSYFVMLENGAVLSHAAGTLHEFFHDGRHFAGVPCH